MLLQQCRCGRLPCRCAGSAAWAAAAILFGRHTAEVVCQPHTALPWAASGPPSCSLCRLKLLNAPDGGCCSFSHPVGELNETSLSINDGAGIIEGINSSDASGNALCGSFTIRGKVPFDPWATLQVRQLLRLAPWLAGRSEALPRRLSEVLLPADLSGHHCDRLLCH